MTTFTRRIAHYERSTLNPGTWDLNKPLGVEVRTATVDGDGWGYQTTIVHIDPHGCEVDREEIRRAYVPGEPGETVRAWLPNGRAEPVMQYNPRMNGRVSIVWPSDPKAHVAALAQGSISDPA